MIEQYFTVRSHIYIHTNIRVCIYMYINTYIYAYTQIFVFVCVYIYIYLYTFNYPFWITWNSPLPIWLFGKILFVFLQFEVRWVEASCQASKYTSREEYRLLINAIKHALTLWCVMPQQSRRAFLVLNGNTKALIFYKLIYGCKAGTHFNTHGWQTKPKVDA